MSPARPATEVRVPESERFSLRRAVGLFAERRYRMLAIVAGLLGLVTVGDGLLYLGLQRRVEFDTALFPLLFVGTAAVYMLCAVPAGRLADRWGRRQVFISGYVLLLGAYATLLIPSPGTPALALTLVLLGIYYAATDGVLMAIAGAQLPESLRASGMSFLVTGVGLARFAAAVAFGALWTVASLETAVLVFACALALAIALAVVLMPREPALAND
jgi:MFS family permease